MQQLDETRAGLLARVGAQSNVNDMFTGITDAAKFIADSPLSPAAPAWASIEWTNTTEAGNRRFEEYRYIPKDGSRAFLPVGFMFESRPDGSSEVRVYSDHHLVEDRAPILPVVDDIHPWQSESDVLYAYFQALNGNRLEEVLDLFDHDGYFRHSNAETFTGRDELRIDFTKMMGSSGIRVQYCQFTDDGTTCAAEVYMPSGRPAVALYQRSATPGRLHAVRIYL
ncbi:nuclear transport factor 2 family protein [Rhizobium alvei]|uniref:Nuclear transport factor 2 family protein n=1 Tax=Rhizobium alvei TaxID=1132659 RepID=A0ABT8YSQ2_9HYPH|nr:nuclear transport factor 2 family protein [Rhizobium alvei]MDO6966367.1 nuclear transport factor 2 family protein [Rhizobium alvei]